MHRMYPEAASLIFLFLISSASLIGFTESKVLSRGLETLEALWKLGWAGYRNFPKSYPHLSGLHVNQHSWQEVGSIPMGLPVEGILERKDHPLHLIVKMMTKSKSPIATHLSAGSRIFEVPKGKPVMHIFKHDRLYSEKLNDKLRNPSPPIAFTPSLLIDSGQLGQSILSDGGHQNHIPTGGHNSHMFPATQLLIPLTVPHPPASASRPVITMAILDPVSETRDPLNPGNLFPASDHQSLDPLPEMSALMLAFNQLPVYTPISDNSHPPVRQENWDDESDEYEKDLLDIIESSSAAAPKSFVSEPPAVTTTDVRSMSSEPEETTSSLASREDVTTISPVSGDLEADEDRRQEQGTWKSDAGGEEEVPEPSPQSDKSDNP